MDQVNSTINHSQTNDYIKFNKMQKRIKRSNYKILQYNLAKISHCILHVVSKRVLHVLIIIFGD